MVPHRLTVKYFVANPEAVNLPALVPVFHRWIQFHSLEGLLVDVADYRHVHHGPGVILIGYEADYGLDLAQGRPGLLYRRKQEMPADLPTALRVALHQALRACHLLENESSLHPGLRFRTDEVEIALLDRLRFPNTTASFDAVRPTIEALLGELYDDGVHVERVANDPRQPLTIQAVMSQARGMTTLLARLGDGRDQQ